MKETSCAILKIALYIKLSNIDEFTTDSHQNEFQ